jgi:hypothetical protein
MRCRIAAGGILVLVLALAAVPARAQTTVQGGVVVQSGPVTGRVEVNSPPPVVVHREPVREVIVVERTHVPRGKAHGWWKKHGYRAVTVYYDGARYYGRRVERTGLYAVIVYERKGRYYISEEDSERHRHHHDDDQGEDD